MEARLSRSEISCAARVLPSSLCAIARSAFASSTRFASASLRNSETVSADSASSVQLVGQDVGKAAEHHELLRLAAFLLHGHDARTDRGHDGRMIGHDGHLAVRTRKHDFRHLGREQQLLGRHEFEIEAFSHWTCTFIRESVGRGNPPSGAQQARPWHHQAASAASFLAFSTASSIVPTM